MLVASGAASRSRVGLWSWRVDDASAQGLAGVGRAACRDGTPAASAAAEERRRVPWSKIDIDRFADRSAVRGSAGDPGADVRMCPALVGAVGGQDQAEVGAADPVCSVEPGGQVRFGWPGDAFVGVGVPEAALTEAVLDPGGADPGQPCPAGGVSPDRGSCWWVGAVGRFPSPR